MGDNERVDNNMPEGPSLARKRKVMHPPDGFESLKGNTKVQISTRQFASAFDDPKRLKLTSRDSPLRGPRPLTHLSPTSHAHAGPSKEPSLRLLRPPVLPVLNPIEFGPSKAAPVITTGSRSTTPLRARATDHAFSPNSTTKFSLQGAADSPRAHAKPVSRSRLQKLQPPAPPPLPEPIKPTRRITLMKPPPPPVPPRKGPPLPDVGKLKTISTTRVAVALDPRTESGTDELMALHLEQNASTYVPPAERELIRGLGQSPEKASKAKTAKFGRGGLAERAKCLFSEQRTALALWYKDMALQASRPQTYARLPPDLYLRIVQVLHVASIVSLQRSQNVPRLCIVRCTKVIRERTTGNLTVLLDFGGPGSTAGQAHTLDEIKEGRDVHVWRPWNTSQMDEEQMRRHGAPPRDGSTLFCTRFRII